MGILIAGDNKKQIIYCGKNKNLHRVNEQVAFCLRLKGHPVEIEPPFATYNDFVETSLYCYKDPYDDKHATLKHSSIPYFNSKQRKSYKNRFSY